MNIGSKITGKIIVIPEVTLNGATLSGLNLHRFDFNNAKIEGLRIYDSDAGGIEFSNTTLKDVVIQNTTISNSFFDNTTINNTMFINCMMYGAIFTNSILYSVIFEKCNIGGADFSLSEFAECKFIDVHFDEYTIFPDCFDFHGCGLRI